MQEVWVIEQKDGNTWKPQMYLGVHRWENNARGEMHRHIQTLQINEMRTIPDMRSPKRGEGKRAFQTKMREIAEIPSHFRVCELKIR